MRTFDNRGMGDLSPDVQAQLDAEIATPLVVAPAPAVTVPAMTFSFQQLLQPPYIYFVVAGLAFAAYLYKGKR